MRLFLDVDGVLTDFVTAAHNCRGIPAPQPWPYKKGPDGWNFYKEIGLTLRELFAPMSREVWANMDWMPLGRDILQACENLECPMCLLSAPASVDGCIDGRRDWVKRNMPKYVNRLMMGQCKEMCANWEAILVDDNSNNINDWIEAGGKGVLVPMPWNTMHRFYEEGRTLEQVKLGLRSAVTEIIRESVRRNP